jgi:hypothetical protein
MRNEGSDKPLKSFAVSIDKVEQVTGLDFFPQLPDDLRNHLESTGGCAALVQVMTNDRDRAFGGDTGPAVSQALVISHA